MTVFDVSARFRGFVSAVAVLATLALTGSILLTGPAASAATTPAAVSSATDADSGFPLWYQDEAGTRLAACTDAADPQCVLPAAGEEPGFDPDAPLAFPGNFPSEFFYSVADSELVTAGCDGATPGLIKLRLAVEGAFANETPQPGDQMVFGRVRVVVRPGSLCPNTTYTVTQPYGDLEITTDDSGAVPAAAGTSDLGCVPAPGLRCDFGQALASPIFGGFLHWPAGSAGLPAGYLGDGATPHVVEGSPSGTNLFRVASATGATVAETDLFTVSGKLAGPLLAQPASLDFGGVQAGSDTVLPVTVTNVDADPVTVPVDGLSLAGADAAQYEIADGSCAGAVLARDEQCSVAVRFAPDVPAPGRRTASLLVGHDGVGSPLAVALTGAATEVGAQASLDVDPAQLSFGDQRLRVFGNTDTVTISNAASASAPLGVTGITTSGEAAGDFRVEFDPCSGRFLDPGQSCTVTVGFVPSVLGTRTATLEIASNDHGSPAQVALTGTGTGGVAAASPDRQFGFPTWYQDENGVRLAACADGRDPGCVLPAAGEEPDFDPSQPSTLPGPPLNFPSEFFWTVADSDQISTPACAPNDRPGRIAIRVAMEGAFTNEGPVDGDQMAFGRIRVSATGLCADTTYDFVNPYGVETLTTDATGRLRRPDATEDIGCAPVAPQVCDFDLPLQSRVLSGFLRWDPSVQPNAPDGYIGDALTPHQVIGGSYVPPGAAEPVNYFEIRDHETGARLGRTDLWTVAGKLAGPLVADPSPTDLGIVTVGDTSNAKTVTLTNDGPTPLTVNSLGVQGADATEFSVAAESCTGVELAAHATCTADVAFSPQDTGTRTATLAVDHTGLNSALLVPLTGVGGAPSGAALNVSPGQLQFGQLRVGRSTTAQTVTVDNIGGQAPLHVSAATIGGLGAGSFAITGNTCAGATVPVGGSCRIGVAMTPAAGGDLPATLDVSGTGVAIRHVTLTGTGFDGNPAVGTVDPGTGFPESYQDANGVGVVACLDGADTNCVLPGAGEEPGFDPGQATSFPDNFPSEFFYWVADSDLIATPGCNGIAPGLASARLALEGAFAGTAPLDGDQITFGRVRVRADGLCPDTDYTVTHPYGTDTVHTDADGAFDSTDDVGCGPVAPATCDFSEALGSRVTDSFLRFDPAFGAAPEGYLGDGVNPHRITGSPTETNYLSITGPSGAELRTDLFTVAGKLSGAPSVPGTPVPDRANPFVALTAPAFGSTQSATVTVAAQARDNIGVESVQFRVDGTDVGAADTTAPYSLAWDTRTVGDGTHVLTAVARDAAGREAISAPRSVVVANTPAGPGAGGAPPAGGPAGGGAPVPPGPVVVPGPVGPAAADILPPVAAIPARGLLAATRLGAAALTGGRVPVVVSFTATDPGGSGVAGFQLQQSVNGGPFRAVVLSRPTATSATVLLRPGPGTHRFRVRAVDGAGNVGAWVTGRAFRLRVAQDGARGLTYRGGWQALRRPAAFGGTAHEASAAGSSASFAFTGSRVSWVSARGPQQGMAAVYLDGRRIATVDGYAPVVTNRAIVLTRDVAPGRHRLEIRALHSHNSRARGFAVTVDAFLVVSD